MGGAGASPSGHRAKGRIRPGQGGYIPHAKSQFLPQGSRPTEGIPAVSRYLYGTAPRPHAGPCGWPLKAGCQNSPKRADSRSRLWRTTRVLSAHAQRRRMGKRMEEFSFRMDGV
ncbi:hypothetical protein SRHO_G00304030 [Serrasalmus rhombeus]